MMFRNRTRRSSDAAVTGIRRPWKVVTAAVVATGIAVSLGACSSGAGSNGDGKGDVTFFSWDNETTMKPLIAEFEKENPGITIKFSYAPPVPTYVNTLQKRLLAGTAADVFILGNHTQQAGGGYVKALDGTAAAKAQSPFGTKMNTYKGHVYGISISTWGGGLLVNKDLAAKGGVTSAPKSWSELLDDFSKLKAAGITPYLEASDGIPTSIMGLIGRADANSGGNMDANIFNGKTTFSKAWTAPLQTWQQLYTKGLVSSDTAALKGPQVEAEFQAKRVAMISDGSWAIASMRTALPGTQLDYWPIPSETAGQTFWAGAASPPYAINAKAKNPVGAQKFVDFLAGAKGVAMMHDITGVITTTNNYSPKLDPALEGMYKDVVAGNVWCTWQAWPGANSDALDATFLASVQQTMLGQSDATKITAALDQKWATLK